MRRLFSPLSRMAWLVLLMALASTPAVAESVQVAAAPRSLTLDDALARLAGALPGSAQQCMATDAAAVRQSATAVEYRAYQVARFAQATSAKALLDELATLLSAKDEVDRLRDSTIELRTELAALEPDERTTAICNYLKTVTVLVDLSGRLRYLLYDAIDGVAVRLGGQPQRELELVDLLVAHRSGVGATVLAAALAEPLDGRAASDAYTMRVLELIAATRQYDMLPTVAALVRDRRSGPALVLAAAETIRAVGLPQDPHPLEDPELPPPAITAAELRDRLARLDRSGLTAAQVARQQELIAWLTRRADEGLTEEVYRWGDSELRAGDWLLMRNPSPYNLFTDLSPGLFTHVGVVALDTAADGRRRMVLVDLPEVGNRMQVTPVDRFVLRTLHYVFLRHDDPAAAARMGETAAALIGNEAEFDLNFRTDRVRELHGQPLAGQKIKTYCAGVLYLCAQESGTPPEAFFPLPEAVAGGNTAVNLERLGLSFGEDFVSPTGAVFSPRLHVVGRREPMYEPTREIEEAVFNHFAHRLVDGDLQPANSLYQRLRIAAAETSQSSSWLSWAMAKAAGVHPDTDLVSAAKAGAVVEALDEAAYMASGEFLDARDAIRAGPLTELTAAGFTRSELARVTELRERHADLFRAWLEQRIDPRQLREALVDYYIRAGQQQIDTHFFSVR